MEYQEEIQKIVERNHRVELDKAWETSWARRLLIAVFTYIVALVWLLIIDIDKALLSAAVPAGGFLLSTLTIPAVKSWWIKRRHD